MHHWFRRAGPYLCVVAALIYPAILAVLSMAVVVFLMVYFIPKFDSMFADFGAALPVLTQLIVDASRVTSRYGLFAVVGLACMLYAFRSWLHTEAGRRQWEGSVLRIPVIGALTGRFAMTRFCRMLGTLTGAGVPLVSALNVARESLGN